MPKHGTRWRILLTFLAILVVIQNWVLIWQNHTLRALVDPPPVPIELGAKFAQLSGMGMAGVMKLVQPPKTASEKLLLITMSPGCSICRSNLAEWSALTQDISHRNGWRVVWVSRDPLDYTRRSCEEHNIQGSVVLADPSYSTYRQLRLGGCTLHSHNRSGRR